MKKITMMVAAFVLLFLSCHKQEIERIPAPIGDGVIIDSSTFVEIDSARSLLLCRIKKCEAMQARPYKRAKAVEEIEVSTCHDMIKE